MPETRFNKDRDRDNFTDINASTMRSLSDSVNGLTRSIKNLSISTMRLGTQSMAGSARAVASQFEAKSPAAGGLIGAAAIHPAAGMVIRGLIDKSAPVFKSQIIPAIKEAFKRKAQNDAISNSPMGPTEMSIKEFSIGRGGRRLGNTSYEQNHGSNDIVEALDRLRISNAEWLKASRTLTPQQMKNKQVPSAAVGGMVTQSGQATVHRGEAIVPAGTLQIQTQYLQDISEKLGMMAGPSQAEMLREVIGDLPVFKQVGSLLKPFTNLFRMFFRTRIPGMRGKAMFYAGQAAKGAKSPIDRIANATVGTYGYLRFHGENIEDLLNDILEAVGGRRKGAGELKVGRDYDETQISAGLIQALSKGLIGQGSKEDVLANIVGPLFNLKSTKDRKRMRGTENWLKEKLDGEDGSILIQMADQMSGGMLGDLYRAIGNAKKRGKGLRDRAPKAAVGGLVTATGRAIVHEGEEIIPASQQYANMTLKDIAVQQLMVMKAQKGIVGEMAVMDRTQIQDEEKEESVKKKVEKLKLLKKKAEEKKAGGMLSSLLSALGLPAVGTALLGGLAVLGKVALVGFLVIGIAKGWFKELGNWLVDEGIPGFVKWFMKKDGGLDMLKAGGKKLVNGIVSGFNAALDVYEKGVKWWDDKGKKIVTKGCITLYNKTLNAYDKAAKWWDDKGKNGLIKGTKQFLWGIVDTLRGIEIFFKSKEVKAWAKYIGESIEELLFSAIGAEEWYQKNIAAKRRNLEKTRAEKSAILTPKQQARNKNQFQTSIKEGNIWFDKKLGVYQESWAKGGLIQNTGLALVHKGEYVIPRNRVMNGSVSREIAADRLMIGESRGLRGTFAKSAKETSRNTIESVGDIVSSVANNVVNNITNNNNKSGDVFWTALDVSAGVV